MKTLFKPLLGLASLAFALAANAQQPHLRIQDYPGIVGTLTRVAVEKGYCEQAGIKCSIQVINTAPLGIQTLLSKDIEVSLANVEVALQAAQRGAKLKVIASSMKSNPFMLAVGNHVSWPNLKRGYPDAVKDLKGRKIGVTARGSAAEFQARLMLTGAGLNANEVTFVAVGAPLTGYAALSNGQVDALLSFLPIDGFCDVLKTCTMAVQPHKGEGPRQLTRLNNGSGATYVVREDFLQSNPAAVRS
ncbi:MAG: ABC transporter substrate-binding protein, partial [Burkholderiaceae bacterium]